MKKLAKYLVGYRKECVLGPLGKLCEATLELIVPLIVAVIIDRGIGEKNSSIIISMSLLLVLLGAVGLLFSVFAQYFSAKAAVGFITKVKLNLFSHIQSLSYRDLDDIGTSTLITRMTTDASRVQTGLNLALRLLLRSPFVVFGAMIMAFTIDTTAGIAFAVTIPALALVVFGIMLVTTPLYKKVQSRLDKVLLRTRENLSGVRVIRAFGKEDEEYSAFKAEDEALTASQERVGKISALTNPLTYIIINLGIVALIHIGAIKVNIGSLTQGEVIALYNYMSQILVELVKLANLIITISKATASAGRISALLDVKPTMVYGERTEPEKSEYAVELDGVSLKYGRSKENSIEGISIKVKVGERIGIIGGTGSGKSSLINLIGRFYDATGGEVRLQGAPIGEYTKEYLNKTVSVVPQRAVLFKGTIRDNIKWGNRNADDAEILRALEIAQAGEIVREKGGLDYMIEAGGRNLSGGQKQRLTIARAIVSGAKIIILDDSASALDFATEARLREALKTLSADTTLFVVSQRSASVMSLDRIIVMEDGEISAIGTHDELYESSEIYREIYLSQFSGEGENEK